MRKEVRQALSDRHLIGSTKLHTQIKRGIHMTKKVLVLLTVVAPAFFGVACKNEANTNNTATDTTGTTMTDTGTTSSTMSTDTSMTGTTGTMSTDTSGTTGTTSTSAMPSGTST